MSKLGVFTGIAIVAFVAGTVWARQPKQTGGADMEIGHIHVSVRDLPSALAWFDKVLGWKAGYKSDRMAILDSKPIHVILDAGEADTQAIIAFASEDVDADYRRLVGRGAAVLEEPTDKPYGVRAAYIKGPGALKFEIEGPLSRR